MIRTLALLLLSANLAAQCPEMPCPGDSCTEPQTLQGPTTDGQVVCAEQVTSGCSWSGVVVTWYCNHEDEPGYVTNGVGVCYTSEYDYWVLVDLTESFVGGYIFDLQSDYATTNDFPDGIQMSVWEYPYSGWCPGTLTPPVEGSFGPGQVGCSPDNNPQQNWTVLLDLEPGQYLVQIDGQGFSFGTSQLCISGVGVLGLGVPELVNTPEGLQIQRNGKRYDLAGRLIE